MTTQRTIRTIKLVVETQGMTRAEHEKRVAWAETNIGSANQFSKEAFITTVVLDEHGKVIRFTGNGIKATPETEEIVRDLTAQSD